MSLNTVKAYSAVLRNFAAYVPPDIESVTVAHIEGFLFSQSTHLAPATINVRINAIKSFYNWLEKGGHPNLGRFIRSVPVMPADSRVITSAEYALVCSISCPELDCFRFLCNTGLRVSEFVALTAGNIKSGFCRIIGKGRRQRSIPLNKTAGAIVAADPSFSFIRHRNRVWVFRLCRKLAASACIPPFGPHSCRHYFANELHRRGVDIYTISRLLGHASTQVTESVYIHWSEETLRGSTDCLNEE